MFPGSTDNKGSGRGKVTIHGDIGFKLYCAFFHTLNLEFQKPITITSNIYGIRSLGYKLGEYVEFLYQSAQEGRQKTFSLEKW